MIYQRVSVSDPIRQGDIFSNLPRVDISLQSLVVLTKGDGDTVAPLNLPWREAISDDRVAQKPGDGREHVLVRAALPLAAVSAIVISQDCDASRDVDISLSEIGQLPEVWNQAKTAKGGAWFAEMLTRQGQDQLKFFYLPEEVQGSEIVGFATKMAAAFNSILRLPRDEIEAMRELRVGRLNDEAYEHFREKLAEFFRRYPVDPWYPLNQSEFAEYRKKRGGVQPRAWQE